MKDEPLQSGHFFTFRVPYAGTSVDWEILFDLKHPTQPPDFVCAEDVTYDPMIYPKLVQSWDFHADDSLIKLFGGLTKVYRQYQVKIKGNDSVAAFESSFQNHFLLFISLQAMQAMKLPKIADLYRSLVRSGINQSHVELFHQMKERRVNILVKLDLEDQDMPILQDSDNFLYAGLLFVLALDGKVLSRTLVASPYLKKLLGRKLESFNFSQNLDFQAVRRLTHVMQLILKAIREEFDTRRHIVAVLRTLYPENVFWYDKVAFRKAALVFSKQKARYMVGITLFGEPKLALFALDRPIKFGYAKGGAQDIPISETHTLSFSTTPSSPDFPNYLHTTLTSKIEPFVNTVTKFPTVKRPPSGLKT